MARIAGAGWRYVRKAPGTFMWLAILALTSVVLSKLPHELRHRVLLDQSTNLDQLRRNPIQVLIASAFWTSSPSFVSWFVWFNLLLVPAERWLGTARWLIVVAAGHIGATLLSQLTLMLAIMHHAASRNEIFVLDVGVSYALTATLGVLAYRFANPWWIAYVIAVVVYVAKPVLTGPSFTDYGHFFALLIGIACYPLTRHLPRWDPITVVTAIRVRYRARRLEQRQAEENAP